MTSIEEVLGAFADAWKRGERPDVDEHLARVPESEREELASAISSWLEVAPMPDYDDEALAAIRKEPALVSALEAAREAEVPWSARVALARRRAGLRLDDVARRLGETFGFGDEQAARAEDYLERLEADELDERRVSRRLVGALATALGTDRSSIEPARAVPAQPAAAPTVAFYRADPDGGPPERDEASIDLLGRALSTPAPEPMDDVDRLFRGGPDA